MNSLSHKLDDYDENEMKTKSKICIIWSCVQLMAKPLSFMNVCKLANGDNTAAKVITDELLKILTSHCHDPFKLIRLEDFYPKILDEDRERQLKLWSFGIGTLFFCEPENVPLCYDPFYIFSVLMPAMINMLEFVRGTPSHYLRQEKSLKLLKSCLLKLPKHSVPSDALEMKDHTLLMISLQHVIVFHGLESLRKLAFEVYNLYFNVYSQTSAKSLTLMVLQVFEKANHSGLIGHAIGKLKDAVLKDTRNPQLTGDALKVIVRKFCFLKNGAETDLLEISDEVMASLNFLICLLLRDKSSRIHGLWSMVPELEKNYLKPLGMGLSMSKAHYKLKLDDSNSTKNKMSQEEVTLMVGGQPLPDMSPDQMKEVLHSALNTFEMIECVLCQLNDIIASK